MSFLAQPSAVHQKKSRKSERLKSLSEDAKKIRLQHNDGLINAQEAAERLQELRRRHATIFDLIFR